MGARKKRHKPDSRLALPVEDDDRYPITGASPPAYMVRLVGGFADYDADDRPHTTGTFRNVAAGVLLALALLIGVALLLM